MIQQVFLFLVAMEPATQTETVVLKPQDVVDRVISHSYRFKDIEWQAQLADVERYRIGGLYDWQLKGMVSYDIDRRDDFSGIQNTEDRNLVYEAGVAKKFSTGSLLDLNYRRNYQSSKLSSFAATTREPDQVLDSMSFGARQSLFRNALGIGDRARLNAALEGVRRSDLVRKEDIEVLLINSLEMFWRTYIAKEDLRYALLARDRYANLVKRLEGKLAQQLAEKFEASRARAEFENKDKEVKMLSLLYLNLSQNLATLLQIDKSKSLELVVDKSLPKPAAEFSGKIESSRRIESAKASLRQADLLKQYSRWATFPAVDLFGQVELTGVGRNGGKSFSKVGDVDRPYYQVGVELSFNLFSDTKKGEQLDAELRSLRAMNELQRVQADVADEQDQAFRDVQSKYLIAESALRTFEAREKVIQDQERRYRRGLVSLGDLIQDYNFFYASQSARSDAVADYHLSLMRMKAADDTLVP